ncbi:MAG: carboxypeptidase regulatory-like domain-containing protein [Candidatus Bathyarchaeota archaeon]|nr:carboxypeptidase regulatory-like domain-containing protein [Candidatus Bathyarchaeota archaeon]
MTFNLAGEGRMQRKTEIALTIISIILLSSSILTTTQAMTVAGSPYSGSTHVRAFIDGSDFMYIQFGGAIIWYEHRNYDLPGLWDGHHEFTYIDGDTWTPDWTNYPYSDKYYSPAPHPTADWTITSLDIDQAREEISIAEQPSSSNGYTAKILLNDDNRWGAEWYEFTLYWDSTVPAVSGTNMYLSMMGPNQMDRGESMTYSLFYNNFGGEDASNVVLEATLSPYVVFESATNGGTFDSATSKVTWNIGTSASFPDGQGLVAVTVNIPETTEVCSIITSTASISTTTTETSYDDNQASASTTVTGTNLPPSAHVGPLTGTSGTTPTLYWGTPTVFTYTDPLFGTTEQATSVDINIHVDDGEPDIFEAMSGPSSTGVWTYTTTFYPRHGEATVTYYPHRPSEPTPIPIQYNIYIDPAGYVYDATTGARIEGATVWLQRSNGNGGWQNVPTGLGLMIPDTNPLTTNENGQYQWDTIAGSYRVHVEADGYYPADSAMVTVPPPVFDLNVGLTPIPSSLTASFTKSESTTEINNPISFDPSSSSGINSIVQFEWDWTSDGTYDTTTATPSIETHAYTAPGTYTITLRVTDSLGNTDTTSQQVLITPAFPVPESLLGTLLTILAGFAALATIQAVKHKKPHLSFF